MKQTILGLLLLLSFGAAAQKTKNTLTIGGTANAGNLDMYTVSTQASVVQDSTNFTWAVNGRFDYGKLYDQTDGWSTKQRESLLSGTVAHDWGKWKVIGFMEFENSYLKKILVRGSSGIGVGHDIINNSKVKFMISEAVMPDYYFSIRDIDKNLLTIRASTRIKLTFGKRVKFSSISFIQPSLWNDQGIGLSNNITVRSNNNIDFPISKKVAIGFQFNIVGSTLSTYFDNTVRPYDYSTLLTLKLKNF
jgi:hypothetical protein